MPARLTNSRPDGLSVEQAGYRDVGIKGHKRNDSLEKMLISYETTEQGIKRYRRNKGLPKSLEKLINLISATLLSSHDTTVFCDFHEKSEDFCVS